MIIDNNENCRQFELTVQFRIKTIDLVSLFYFDFTSRSRVLLFFDDREKFKRKFKNIENFSSWLNLVSRIEIPFTIPFSIYS